MYVHSIIKSVIEKNIEKALQSINEVLEEGKDLENFLWEMIKHTKDILMYKVSKKVELYNDEEVKEIAEVAENVSKDELINIVYKLSELENKMRLSSQKTIIFETEIIKLCMNIDILGLEDRISNLEKRLENGEIKPAQRIEMPSGVVQPARQPEKVMMPKETPKTQEAKKQDVTPKKEEKAQEVKAEPLQTGEKMADWSKVLGKLKEHGKVMLYANLINTEAVALDDLTVSIRFNGGLTAFGKTFLEKPENMNEITKEVSMIFGKPMHIKLESVDTKAKKVEKAPVKQETKMVEETPEDILGDLDIPINYIEEE